MNDVLLSGDGRLAEWLVRFLAGFPRPRLHLARGARLNGRAWIRGGGKVEIGEFSSIEASELSVELHAEETGEIIIGRRVEIGGGTSIEATSRVAIGDDVRIGRLCKILDNNFHQTSGDWNRRPPSRPVEIGAGAIIGERAILLPGASVSPGDVVPAGAVVRGIRHSRPEAAEPSSALPLTMNLPAKRSFWQHVREPFGSIEILIALWRAKFLFRRKERSEGIRLRGIVRVTRGGKLRVGPRVVFLQGVIPTVLNIRPGATLAIGENTSFNYGTTLDASVGITIGANCRFGSMVVLRDDDGETRGPIVLGDRVWLAHGVVVKPGVTIGSGVVVSAGSIVESDVPDDTVFSGNPARPKVPRKKLQVADDALASG